MRSPRRRIGAAAVWGLTTAAGAQAITSPYADLKISSTINSSITYQIGTGANITVASLNNASFRVSSDDSGFVSELGFDLTSNLSGDSFSYLHNAYCVGTCSVSMTTNLTFTLTNSGTAPLNVRWDSLITPGHLAQVGLDGAAQFYFSVLQTTGSSNATTLYSANGLTGGYYDQINASDGAFNGLLHQDYSETAAHLNAKTISDWSATNLNLNLLTIDPGTTSTLLYVSQASVGSNAKCTDLMTCDGIQVAFGDPRTSGAATNLVKALFAAPPIGMADADTQPIIGRQYQAYEVGSAFVPQGTLLPDTPTVLPAVNYGPNFVSQVPEPTIWTLMLCGFGLVGAASRRRLRMASARV